MNENLKIEELLFNDEPITINRKLAKCIGLKEAVVFQQIHYWLKINEKKNHNFIQGRYWTFNSIKKWHEKEFDFLSFRTLERIFKALENEGLLICKTFNKMEGDKTKWYSINYDKLIEVAELRLRKKESLSKKRSKAGKRSVLVKKEKANKLNESSNNATSQNVNTIQPNWQNGAYNQIGGMVPPNWQNGSAKLAEPIPETTTKISTEISLSSSTINLIKVFEENICELKKTTREKFIKYISSENEEFVWAVIEYQAAIRTKSWAGFNKAIENFKNNNIHTSEELKIFIEEYHASKGNSKITEKKENIEVIDNAINEMTYFDEIIDSELDITGAKNLDFIKEYLKDELEEIKFNTWIKNLVIVEKDGDIIIKTNSSFHRGRIKKNYINLIKRALIKNEINGRIKLC